MSTQSISDCIMCYIEWLTKTFAKHYDSNVPTLMLIATIAPNENRYPFFASEEYWNVTYIGGLYFQHRTKEKENRQPGHLFTWIKYDSTAREAIRERLYPLASICSTLLIFIPDRKRDSSIRFRLWHDSQWKQGNLWQMKKNVDSRLSGNAITAHMNACLDDDIISDILTNLEHTPMSELW